MPDYNLGNEYHNVEALMNHQICRDVVVHLAQIFESCELRKCTKVKGIAKVANIFKNKTHADLFLWHPSMETQYPHEGYIRVADLASRRGRRLYYKLTLLGEETQKADLFDRATLYPNTIEINVTQGWKVFAVAIELSGPAFFSFLGDQGCKAKTPLVQWMRDKLRHRWGSTGVEYGTYSRTDGEKGDGYRYIRMNNGISQVQTEGMGWMTSQPYLF